MVGILTELLARNERQPTINAHLVSALLNLHAVESAEVIERAFAAEVVEEWVCGGWLDARAELGVEGLSIAPLRPRKAYPWAMEMRGLLTQRESQLKIRADQRHDAKREKAKRRAADKTKKRNRRAK